MKIISFLLFFLVVSGVRLGAATLEPSRPKPLPDRKEYYSILKTGDLAAINRELAVVGSIEGNDGKAYSGTLLMRKAGLLKVPAEKLKAFKKGRIGLETAIAADPANVEYHFLRLIIQEHAPKIVKYREQLETDRELIRQHFARLPADLREAIKDYSATSAVLHPADL
jgi:hypothetical protein